MKSNRRFLTTLLCVAIVIAILYLAILSEQPVTIFIAGIVVAVGIGSIFLYKYSDRKITEWADKCMEEYGRLEQDMAKKDPIGLATLKNEPKPDSQEPSTPVEKYLQDKVMKRMETRKE